jgi:hypothetical protein
MFKVYQLSIEMFKVCQLSIEMFKVCQLKWKGKSFYGKLKQVLYSRKTGYRNPNCNSIKDKNSIYTPVRRRW